MPNDGLVAGVELPSCSHAAWRGAAGLRTLRYRANLRRRRRYELHSADIPWSVDRLFLGRGFRWDQRHTQRLFEARLPVNRPLLKGGPFAGASAAFIPTADEFGGVGGDPTIHGVEPDETEIWMDLEDRVGHTLVLGTTRVGKTRLAELLITQDIRRGEVVIVFDPKGDAELLRRMVAEAKRAGRLSNRQAPRQARLPTPKPTTINPKDSRYERGTTGGQVIGYIWRSSSTSTRGVSWAGPRSPA